MTALPSSNRLAEIVTGVTKTMLGLSFVPDTSPNPWSSLVWRTAVLRIQGEHPLTAGLLKPYLSLNQPLGLPKIVHGSDAPYMMSSDGRHVLVPRAQDIGLVLWVIEGLA